MRKRLVTLQAAAHALAGRSLTSCLQLANHTLYFRPKSRWEARAQALLLALLATQQAALAQGGTAAALNKVQTTIFTIVQVVFIILISIGLVRVMMKFANGAPDALSSLGWLVGGVVLWFGFQFFKNDLASAIGGTGGVSQ